MDFPIDSYEMRARYAPGFILAAPLLVTLWTCAPVEFQGLSNVASGIFSMIVWYSLTMVVRNLGKMIENKEWERLGGNPAAVYILWKNKDIGEEQKKKYHEAVYEKLGLPLSSIVEEADNPDLATERAKQAFKMVKGYNRKNDPKGLWYTDLGDYGFVRNLYGASIVWMVVSLLMALFSFYLYCTQAGVAVLIGFVFNIGMLVFSFYYKFWAAKKLIGHVAKKYAEHSWESFYYK